MARRTSRGSRTPATAATASFQSVTCDWKTFQNLARTGLARHDEDGELALRRALALVRPFAAIDPQRYAWAEPAI